jgi:acylphosphatase
VQNRRSLVLEAGGRGKTKCGVWEDLTVALASRLPGTYTERFWATSATGRAVKSAAIQRREVFYSGNVQGVGFRYTTQHLARRHEVTGFVRNLPDRRVQVVVEGDAAEIRAFLGDVSRTMDHYIRKAEVRETDATGEFGGFEVQF